MNIGTANLDSMRPVIWRIGAIANSGHPDALELIRKILLASASIPAMFAPVLIPVEAGRQAVRRAARRRRRCLAGVPLSPWASTTTKSSNGSRCRADRKSTSSGTPVSIRCTSISGTSSSQSRAVRSSRSFGRKASATSIRIYMQTCRDGLDFNLAYIPAEFTKESTEEFDYGVHDRAVRLGLRTRQRGLRLGKNAARARGSPDPLPVSSRHPALACPIASSRLSPCEYSSSLSPS